MTCHLKDMAYSAMCLIVQHAYCTHTDSMDSVDIEKG